MIDNPAYKGIWVAPDIDNPDYKHDDKLYLQKEIKYVGFELWQVKSGSIFDNIIITDDLAAANKFADETFLKAGKDAEKAMFDKIKEEEKKAEDAKKAEEKKDEPKEDDDDEYETEDDDKEADKPSTDLPDADEDEKEEL
jgi:calreticulin